MASIPEAPSVKHAAIAQDQATNGNRPSKYGKLLDTNGNDFVLPQGYTINQIYAAIPSECFERNIFKSSLYVIQDLTLLAITFVTFNKYATPAYIPSYPVRFGLWSLYTFIQGLFGLGLWVLGHECGHMAFSRWKVINDTMGLLLHSVLLVPYFSWKITHRNHHKGIANMSTDTSYVPPTRLAYHQQFGKAFQEFKEYADDTPIYTFVYLVIHQIVDWQVYMSIMIGFGEHWFEKKARMEGDLNPARNEDGTLVRKYSYKDGHYSPYSPMFTERDAKFIWLTDITLIAWLSILTWVGKNYGWMNLAVWYVVPYLWVNHWLLSITYLHHTDPSIPHYSPKIWTFTLGAAATMDRDFGWIGRHLFHNIIETHVLHHHVSIIPHYHAEKASAAIQEVMGEHYKRAEGVGMWNFTKVWWQNARTCRWVESGETAEGMGKDVLFWRNKEIDAKLGKGKVGKIY